MPAARSLSDTAAAFLRAHDLEAGPLVVGVSGGVDSVALLDVLAGLRAGVVAAHVNYGLRGAASDADEAFVRAACEGRGVACEVLRVGAEERPGAGAQAWARGVRYAFFGEVAARAGARAVAVAHHADDQAETVLLNLVRGAGARGLGGMRPARRLAPGSEVTLVRPFLGARRAEIEAYARAAGLAWRDDASNTDPRYRRAALRAEILPLLEARFGPNAAERIARAAAFVRGADVLARPALARLLRAAVAPDAHGGTVRLDVLAGLPGAVRTRVLLAAARRLLPGTPAAARLAARLDALAAAPVGRRLRWGVGTAWRERGALRFVRLPGGPLPSFTLGAGGAVTLPGGTLALEDAGRPERFARDANTWWFDADALALPLVVRPWRAGDRLRPFGLDGTQRVSDVLTNAHVPSSERALAYVVESGGEVAGVVGVRAGRVAAVTRATRRVLRLRYAPFAAT